MNEILSRIHGTTDMAEIKDCDLVIEAVFEDLAVKKELFSRLDKICGPKTILATNTSSFSINELAKATNRKDRFVGLHFFYHPAMNRLLEIIPGSATSPEFISACKQYSILTGKTDILVQDSPGFAVNRFFVPLNNEATRILEEGWANVPTIDKAIMDALASVWAFQTGQRNRRNDCPSHLPIPLRSNQASLLRPFGQAEGPV